MPRYTLHLPKSSDTAGGDVPAGLRSDPRVKVIDEMPRLLLIESSEEVAREWLDRMPGWKMRQERRANVPDPRPKVKSRKPENDST
jgi:hypothetical protein